MIQTLIRNWWLLALRGLLALLLSVISFFMLPYAETFTLREFALKGMVVFFGILAVTAGACTTAAGIWRASTGKWWLLTADGVIVSAAGFALILSDSLTFRTVTYIVVVLAAAIGLVELGTARLLRRHLSDEWLLGLAGVGSTGFALFFLLIGPKDARPMFIWLGSYSAFSAICMLGLSFRLRSLRASAHRMAQATLQ